MDRPKYQEYGWGAFIVRVSLSGTIGTVSLLLLLAGCTTAPRLPAASEAEQEAGVARYLACLDKNVALRDDRVSDASTVARALMDGPCAEELAASKETYTRNMTPWERRAFEREATAPYQVAIDTVLRHRAIGPGKHRPEKVQPSRSRSMR